MSEQPELPAPGDRPDGGSRGVRPSPPPWPELVSRGLWITATVAFVLAAPFGALVIFAITGRHMFPIGFLNGATTSALATMLWRLIAVGRRRFRPLMGAIAFMVAAIGGVFITSALLMLHTPGNRPAVSFEQILDLAMFAAWHTSQQLGILVFPIAALAGYLVTRSCEVRRLAAIA